MASFNFRSAFHGFNREDVVRYIEFINSKHNAAVNQLRADLTAAREECDALRAEPDLQAKCDRQDEIIADLRAQVLALTEQLELQSARRNEEELEIYRRAERMERQAKEHSQMIFETANGVLADATAKVDEAYGQIAGVADQVAAQLAMLQSAVTTSKQALEDATSTLYSIRPTEE